MHPVWILLVAIAVVLGGILLLRLHAFLALLLALTITPQLTLMGIAGLVATMIGAVLFPLV